MPKVVIPLHGIRTHASWQRAFVEVSQQHHLYCPLEKWSFGHFSLIRFLLPWQREAKIRWFRSTYNDLMEGRYAGLGEDNYPSAVAHSFGTYILGYALLKYRNMKFDKIILCGSILPRSFPWNEIIERGQVIEVRNEYGVKDSWVGLVKWFVKGAGSSGRDGFDIHNERITQEEFVFQHSEYFDRGHMAALWIPFLSRPSLPAPVTIKPVKFPPSPAPLGLYVIYGALLAGIAFLIYSHFLRPLPPPGPTGQIPEVFGEIVEGGPVGDCASEARGSSVQLFENGWLLADFAKNLHFAIWKHEDSRVEWLKVPANSLATEPSCSGVKGAQFLQLGFRAQYCGPNEEALRTALGSPIEEETRAWVQYQRFSGGLLVYGLPGKKLQPENPVFQVLVAAFLERESDNDMGWGRIRAITADSSKRDAYCTALWYQAEKDLSMSPIQQAHLSKCLTTIPPEHYSEKRKSCSLYGY